MFRSRLFRSYRPDPSNALPIALSLPTFLTSLSLAPGAPSTFASSASPSSAAVDVLDLPELRRRRPSPLRDPLPPPSTVVRSILATPADAISGFPEPHRRRIRRGSAQSPPPPRASPSTDQEFRSSGSSSERRPAATTDFEKFLSTLSGGGSALAKDFGSMNMYDLPPLVKAGVVPKIHASAPLEEFLVKAGVARDDAFAPPPPMQPRVEIKSMRHNVLEDILLDGRLEPRNIPFAVLQDITENFSDKRSIGSGGFGVVYKGVLQNGSVTVKKLLNSQTIEDGPFYKEANILMIVKHQNIVRFLGFCAHTENEVMKMERSGRYEKYIYPEKRERLLCFEYISGGSLDNYLAGELGRLGWHTSYEIIKGICEGLQYLHKEMRIVHMDLKPPNILLNDLMIPKITDFGVSRHLDGISQAVTKGGFMSLQGMLCSRISPWRVLFQV